MIFYIAYQQFENYVIYPRVMSRSVDIPGALTVIAALIGARAARRRRRPAGDPDRGLVCCWSERCSSADRTPAELALAHRRAGARAPSNRRSRTVEPALV